MAVLLWVQYHVYTNGGAVTVGAVWICVFACSTMLILMVALCRSVQFGYVGFSAVPCQYFWWRYRGLCIVDMLFWVQYHVNTSGGAVAVSAVWLCCCGCSTSLIIVLAL